MVIITFVQIHYGDIYSRPLSSPVVDTTSTSSGFGGNASSGAAVAPSTASCLAFCTAYNYMEVVIMVQPLDLVLSVVVVVRLPGTI